MPYLTVLLANGMKGHDFTIISKALKKTKKKMVPIELAEKEWWFIYSKEEPGAMWEGLTEDDEAQSLIELYYTQVIDLQRVWTEYEVADPEEWD